MKTWNMFNNVTGIFSGISFSGDIVHLENNTPIGNIPIESSLDIDPRLYKLNISTMQLDKYIPNKPDITLEFDWVWNSIYNKWEKVPTLYTLQNNKYEELKQKFNELNNANILFDNNEFQADEKSKEALFKQYQLSIGNTDFKVNWILADNTLKELTYTSIKELVRLIDVRTQNLVSKLYELRSKIQAASKEELADFNLEI